MSSNQDWIRHFPKNKSQLERIEAFFTGYAYAAHRHDTFAIGVTLNGVQSFNYGGVKQHSLPNMTMILHPDEKHDGEAGTQAGFKYQMAYIKPS